MKRPGPKSNGRIPLREQKQNTQRSLDHYAALYDKPRVVIDIPPEPKRRAPAGADGKPLERDIQKAILQMLSLRKDVVFYGRFNRGQAQSTDAHGRVHYTSFNTVAGFPDIHGMMSGGRAFYLEVKRPGGRESDDQITFIAKVKAGGALAGFAYSVGQAAGILDGKE